MYKRQPDSAEGLCSVCRIKERTKQRQEEARARAQKLKEEREAKKAAEEAAKAAEQAAAPAAEPAVEAAAPAAPPVSYTHLDVYKRQGCILCAVLRSSFVRLPFRFPTLLPLL